MAVVAYDLRPTILSDFSPDKRKAEEAMARLRIPGFSESNVFDALTDMADRMEGIEGRKAILLMGTGLDTFSKITFDKTQKDRCRNPAFRFTPSALLQIARMMAESSRPMGPIAEMDFLQADNEMRTFAKETGGNVVLSPVYRRISVGVPADRRGDAKPVCARLSSDQHCARRQIPAHQSGIGESGHERAAAHDERKGQADQVSDRREGRLQGATREVD